MHLAAGRWFEAGHREIVVGKSIAQRYPDAHFGHHLHFGRGDWQIVGIMGGGQPTNHVTGQKPKQEQSLASLALNGGPLSPES